MSATWPHKKLSLVKSPVLLHALECWRSKAGGGAIPSRAQLDPLEMRPFLPKILIVDIESEDRFVYRLCGPGIVSLNGRELTGRCADAESLGASAPQFIDSYR